MSKYLVSIPLVAVLLSIILGSYNIALAQNAPPSNTTESKEIEYEDLPAPCDFAESCKKLAASRSEEDCQTNLSNFAGCLAEENRNLFCALVCKGQLLPRTCAVACGYFIEDSPGGPYGWWAQNFQSNFCRKFMNGPAKYSRLLAPLCGLSTAVIK
jgi:hypothetical protein